jgi:uncharacterized C2H2 Zn-finger protein
MNDLMAGIKKLTRSVEAIAVAGWNPKPVPLLCQCGRLFRGGQKTWLPHWNKDHTKLAQKYKAKSNHDRVNLLLKMMRAAKPKVRPS